MWGHEFVAAKNGKEICSLFAGNNNLISKRDVK